MASQPKISMKLRRNVWTLVQKIEILDKFKRGLWFKALWSHYPWFRYPCNFAGT